VAGASSVLAVGAALAISSLGDGPHLPKARKSGLRWTAVLGVFHIPAYRASALAYFGHMWELYAMWTITPLLLALVVRNEWPAATAAQLALGSFAVIGLGGFGCIAGGFFSRRHGSAKVAAVALAGSLVCGLAFPFVAGYAAAAVALMLVWGIAVISDSAQFSALVTEYTARTHIGTALTLQTSAGFLLTMVSMRLVPHISVVDGWKWAFVFLAPGPLLGALAMRALGKQPAPSSQLPAV